MLSQSGRTITQWERNQGVFLDMQGLNNPSTSYAYRLARWARLGTLGKTSAGRGADLRSPRHPMYCNQSSPVSIDAQTTKIYRRGDFRPYYDESVLARSLYRGRHRALSWITIGVGN